LPGGAAPHGTLLALATAALACLCGARAMAAGADGLPRTMALEPSVSVTQSFTDNHDASPGGESDAITRLTAGVGFRGRTGALRGFLDYSLSSVSYARHSDRNNLQNALNANLSAELIDNRLQLVTAASISRSAISAFGVQPGSGSDANANTTEVRSLQITPTLRGVLGPGLRYTASLGHSISRAVDTDRGDSAATSANLRIEPADIAQLGWSLDASHQSSAFKQGRESQTDRLVGGLRLNLDALDLQLNANGGTESTNLVSQETQRHNNWGVGLLWTPSPVTRLSADMENRFFGRSHAVSLEHRMPRTIFRVRSARSLSTPGDQAFGLMGPAADLFNSLLLSRFPDAVQREGAVRALLNSAGITDPNRIISAGFLQSATTVQDVQEISAAWNGLRDVAVVTLSRTKSRRADSLTTAIDDLSQTDSVALTSLSLNLSHRLNPRSSLTLSLAGLRSMGEGLAQSSRTTTVELLLTTQFTPESTGSVLMRRGRYRTGQQSYDENAVVASLGLRF
jgi:uncharacterized protein (PEP-CTERM system associated)